MAAKVNALKVTLPSDTEILLTREFDAPRDQVWEAMTKPEYVKQWWGPRGSSLSVCEIDFRVGGRYRYVWRKADGYEMGMGGVFQEIVPPARIVSKELFDEDWTGGETIGTVTFAEQTGKTLLTQTVLYASQASRDGALGTGMTSGMAESYAQLDAYLLSLQDAAKGAA